MTNGYLAERIGKISYYSMFSVEFNNTTIDTGMSVRAYEYSLKKMGEILDYQKHNQTREVSCPRFRVQMDVLGI